MKPLLKAVKTSHEEGKNWRDKPFQFVLDYCATLHTTTNVSPADLMFRHSIHTKLPQLDQQLQKEPLLDPFVTNRDLTNKQKMKEYEDSRRHAKGREIKISDKVLV